MLKSYNAYKETNIKTAGPGKLILMLYDEAVRQLDIALDLMEKESKELDKVNNSLGKTQDIIAELMASLDFDKGGDIAQNLFSLYIFFNQQLMDANIHKSSDPIKKVRQMLVDLREAWGQVISKSGGKSGYSENGGVNIAG
ncbi:MAG: flagellar export chaperone FliS [Spirochaetales bacterium]|nr:flagellar export chaperone FliS [Spirochaetales bacterium]MCF7938586.1 flagellar export chaperone FliS [Spirochaetales bacterium]